MLLNNVPLIPVAELEAAGYSVADFIEHCNSNRPVVLQNDDTENPVFFGIVMEAQTEPVEGRVMGNAHIGDDYAERFRYGAGYAVVVTGWEHGDGHVALHIAPKEGK